MKSLWHFMKFFEDLASKIKEKKSSLKEDFIAGLIVAIVALPLAIGFAIASDVPPAMGVYTAIIAGFFSAIFGGSNFQVSGPTGAMVVVILGVVHAYGIPGLITATFIAGLILILMGVLKLGKIIEYIPSPVIVGFTAGIGTIIFFGQVNNFFGISPIYTAGAGFLSKTFISILNIVNANIGALIISALTVFILIITPKFSKKIPGSIIAVIITTIIILILPGFFHVKTVGEIGKIPTSLPFPIIPGINFEIILNLLPAALTIAALAAIESLLSAVVADGLTSTKHNPNKELVGQGIGNITSSLFGGMPSTGAIARTATNIRNGARTKMSSIFHAIFLLLFVLLLAPLASMIPLAALAGILMYVAFNMIEWERIFSILKMPLSDVTVMITTFLITVLIDLTTAIEVGFILAAILFMKRISDLYNVEDLENKEGNDETTELIRRFKHPDISIYTINGPLFFGAASRFDQRVANTPGGHKPVKIIRMKYIPVIDATGLYFLSSTYKKHVKQGGVVLFSTVHPDVMKIIIKSGLDKELGIEHFFPTTKSALKHALRHAHRMHHENEEVPESELQKFNLTQIDLEEKEIVISQTKDKDPVESILEDLGIKRVTDATKSGIIGVTNVTRKGINDVANVTKNGVDGATKVTRDSINNATKITRKTIKVAGNITRGGIDSAAKATKKSFDGMTHVTKSGVNEIANVAKKGIKKVSKIKIIRKK